MLTRFLYTLITLILFASCRQKQKEVKPEVRHLTEAVYASGVLVPEEEYKLVARTDGYITAMNVKEGDTIKKGEILFELTNSSRNVQEQTAGALVQRTLPVASSTAPAIRELEGRIDLAGTKLRNDSMQYIRYKNLFEQNAISRVNYEKYELQYETAKKELYNLRQQLMNLKLNASLQLQQAENQLAQSRTEVMNGRLSSFTDGIVFEIYKRTGDLVNANQPLALIGRGKMIAKLQVDEDDLDKIKPGQKVLLTMDAFSEKVIEARILRLYPILNKVEQSFRADAVLVEPLPAGIYGLNIEANIITGENKNAIVVPKSALMPGDSLLTSKGMVKVERGAEDGSWVEIRGGITPETIIMIRQ